MLDLVSFDSFRHSLTSCLNAEVLLFNDDKGNIKDIHNNCFVFHERERNQVRFTLVSSPDDLIAFSLNPENQPKDTALLVFPLEPGAFTFNGFQFNEQHIGLITASSGSAYTILTRSRNLWVIVSFKNQSRHLDLMSSSMVPLTIQSQQLDIIRHETGKRIKGPDPKGTPILDQMARLLEEIAVMPPPMRPQQSTGRSRLPRKQIIPRAISLLRQHSGSTPLVKKLSEALQITPQSVRNMFIESLGMAPKAYWLLRKLYMFRDALLSGEYASVQNAAFSQDIQDHGRTAARYKELFREYPSDTQKSSLSVYRQ